MVALFLLLAVLLVGFRARRPVIEGANPRLGRGGEPLILTGRNFGRERGGGSVVIAGVTPSSSAYLEWSDRRISVRVPGEVRSGFVQVVAGGIRSNGVLFANRDYLPVVLAGSGGAGHPRAGPESPSPACIEGQPPGAPAPPDGDCAERSAGDGAAAR